MKITDILEIADKRIKGAWKFEGREVIRGEDIICSQGCHYCGSEIENYPYIAIAPEMEAKLREIVELIPRINGHLRFAYMRGNNAGIQNDILELRGRLDDWLRK